MKNSPKEEGNGDHGFVNETNKRVAEGWSQVFRATLELENKLHRVKPEKPNMKSK